MAQQLSYPCSPHCAGYLREQALRSGLLAELLAALKELHLKTVIGTDDERHAALNRAWAAISLAQPYEAEVEKVDGLQTNVAPQCGVGPSDLTDQGGEP